MLAAFTFMTNIAGSYLFTPRSTVGVRELLNKPLYSIQIKLISLRSARKRQLMYFFFLSSHWRLVNCFRHYSVFQLENEETWIDIIPQRDIVFIFFLLSAPHNRMYMCVYFFMRVCASHIHI